jgi:hypothetical protein
MLSSISLTDQTYAKHNSTGRFPSSDKIKKKQDNNLPYYENMKGTKSLMQLCVYDRTTLP